MKPKRDDVIGLIPAAGTASRMEYLPFSKELYPIGMQPFGVNKQIPKVSSMHLIDSMKKAGVSNFYSVIREGKWDIPAYFNNGRLFDINMAYLIADKAYGVPYTLNQVYPFATDKTIVMGFPDIVFKPEDAYSKLLDQLDSKPEIDVLLGLFPVDDTSKWDTVVLDKNKELKAINIKSDTAGNKDMAWIMAGWRNRFSDFLNTYIESYVTKAVFDSKNELQLSTIFLAALDAGIKIDTIKFERGFCVDIGTQEGLEIYFAAFGKEN